MAAELSVQDQILISFISGVAATIATNVITALYKSHWSKTARFKRKLEDYLAKWYQVLSEYNKRHVDVVQNHPDDEAKYQETTDWLQKRTDEICEPAFAEMTKFFDTEIQTEKIANPYIIWPTFYCSGSVKSRNENENRKINIRLKAAFKEFDAVISSLK